MDADSRESDQDPLPLTTRGARRPRDPIALLMPWVEGEEKELRQHILEARDRASAALPIAAAPHAIALLWMIVETATAWAFAGATVDELRDVRRQCMRLRQCAAFADGEIAR